MAAAPWLLLLDVDSWPMDAGFLAIAAGAAADVAVIGLDIRLPGGRREAGGLPEVHVGCGALVRTDAFRAAENRAQLDGIYRTLTACEQVLVVL